MAAAQRPRVALVFGGQSTEHQISCLTAAAVAGAIDTERYEVYGIGISKQGTWHRIGLDQIAALRKVGRQLPELDDSLPRATLVRETDGVVLVARDNDHLEDPVRLDAAFILLHGPYGEDGTIQGQFEMLGLPYVGSGVTASAVGMDKHFMKVALAALEVPIGPYEVVQPWAWPGGQDEVCARINQNLSYPLFVKPARGGSSVGIVRVADADQLCQAIEQARVYDPKVVVEQGFVGAREIECAVLGPASNPGRDDSTPRTSLPGEIVVHTETGFYDFDAKYLPTEGQVDLNVPADLDAGLQARVQRYAATAFRALGCEGLARVDFFVTAAGQIYVNEVNTMPGFTELSMFPSMWQASGITYPDLIADLIDQALRRPNTVVR